MLWEASRLLGRNAFVGEAQLAPGLSGPSRCGKGAKLPSSPGGLEKELVRGGSWRPSQGVLPLPLWGEEKGWGGA